MALSCSFQKYRSFTERSIRATFRFSSVVGVATVAPARCDFFVLSSRARHAPQIQTDRPVVSMEN